MSEAVNHPAHYTDGKYEVIDFIEKYNFHFHAGNAIKYICRAGKKDPKKEIEDLQKAIWYLKRAEEKGFGCRDFHWETEDSGYPKDLTLMHFLEDKQLGYHRSKALTYLEKNCAPDAIIELEEEIDILKMI